MKRFLLFGDHDGDVFATGGEMEIVQVFLCVKHCILSKVKIIPSRFVLANFLTVWLPIISIECYSCCQKIPGTEPHASIGC